MAGNIPRKVAVLSPHRSLVGGAETYLEEICRYLIDQGVELIFCHQHATDPDALPIDLHDSVDTIQLDDSKPVKTSEYILSRKPELVFNHGIHNPVLESALLRSIPGVCFSHTYVGVCISGSKYHARGKGRICCRVFSPACLLFYFPCRCGGLNPITAFRMYLANKARQRGLHQYQRILVASQWMVREYERNGFRDRVSLVRYPVRNFDLPEPRNMVHPFNPDEINLVFVGRMDPLKGIDLLIRSLPLIAERHAGSLALTVIGDGPGKGKSRKLAESILREHSGISIRFRGWLNRTDIGKALQAATLLIVPSRWPEPFGLVGLEAGQLGIPCVGFEVGGIPEWLKDGVNGRLVTSNSLNPEGVVSAVLSCLSSPEAYHRLSEGARKEAGRYTISAHGRKLLDCLSRCRSTEHLRD